MEQEWKTDVLPFFALLESAYPYCKAANHITENTPQKRRLKFETQAKDVFQMIQDGTVEYSFFCPEQLSRVESLFPEGWLNLHGISSSQNSCICLYGLRIREQFRQPEKVILQFMQEAWCSAFISAAKEKLGQYILEEKPELSTLQSFAPGIGDLSITCLMDWGKIFTEHGFSVKVDQSGHMTPENSLLAVYIGHE